MRILVIAGGDSSEREVSLASGRNVTQALAAIGHDVTQFDPAGLDPGTIKLPVCDVVFLALHGRFGEDGQVQAMLTNLGLPFTGSDANSSARAFDKLAAAKIFAAHDVRTPPTIAFDTSDSFADIRRQISNWGWPVFVKPRSQGSSLGVTRIDEISQLPQAVETAFQFDHAGLIQPAICGTEWTVGLFDELVLPLVKIAPSADFFSYAQKYAATQPVLSIDPEISPALHSEIVQQARRAFECLGCRALARVDLIVDCDNQAWVLEVNTIPGMTPESSIPKAAAAAGFSLGRLCEKMCDAALEQKAS